MPNLTPSLLISFIYIVHVLYIMFIRRIKSTSMVKNEWVMLCLLLIKKIASDTKIVTCTCKQGHAWGHWMFWSHNSDASILLVLVDHSSVRTSGFVWSLRYPTSRENKIPLRGCFDLNFYFQWKFITTFFHFRSKTYSSRHIALGLHIKQRWDLFGFRGAVSRYIC